MLILRRKAGESVLVGEQIRITILGFHLAGIRNRIAPIKAIIRLIPNTFRIFFTS